MKHTKKIVLVLLGVFVLWSCETESTEELKESSAALKTEILTGSTSSVSDPALLENYAQWAAFTTSYFLRYSPETQMQFISNLSRGNTIKFEDIFRDGSTYETLFKDRLQYYLEACCPEPETEVNKPPTPPGTPPLLPGGDVDTQGWAEEIYDYMVYDYCMEFYFPNGVPSPLQHGYTIASTAHPLTGSPDNIGVLRLFQPIVNEDYPDGISTLEFLVNDAHAAAGNYIVVVRPVRPTFVMDPEDPCLYPEYAEIDFTLFLD